MHRKNRVLISSATKEFRVSAAVFIEKIIQVATDAFLIIFPAPPQMARFLKQSCKIISPFKTDKNENDTSKTCRKESTDY